VKKNFWKHSTKTLKKIAIDPTIILAVHTASRV